MNPDDSSSNRANNRRGNNTHGRKGRKLCYECDKSRRRCSLNEGSPKGEKCESCTRKKIECSGALTTAERREYGQKKEESNESQKSHLRHLIKTWGPVKFFELVEDLKKEFAIDISQSESLVDVTLEESNLEGGISDAESSRESEEMDMHDDLESALNSFDPDRGIFISPSDNGSMPLYEDFLVEE